MNNEELFEDWLSDHRIELMAEFIDKFLDEAHTERWNDYIKEEFENR